MTRSNRDRSETMRTALIEAARRLFVARGYADAATPEIVAAAGVTRGALYHHFEDKRALFAAVVAREADAVAAAIDASGGEGMDARTVLVSGMRAFFDAMAVPGRVRLLLLDGPAVLGADALRRIDAQAAEGRLAEGLSALTGRDLADVRALTLLCSAAFDRAALEIEAGAARAPFEAELERLFDALSAPAVTAA